MARFINGVGVEGQRGRGGEGVANMGREKDPACVPGQVVHRPVCWEQPLIHIGGLDELTGGSLPATKLIPDSTNLAAPQLAVLLSGWTISSAWRQARGWDRPL